jgi:hypothetical protein
VWGFQQADGLINWDPELPANKAALEAARAARDSGEARPKAEPGEPQDGASRGPDRSINFGVDPRHLGKRPHYTANSRESVDFVDKVQDHEQPSEKLFVTAIGNPDDTHAVAKDLREHPDLAQFKDKVWFNEFAPTDWQVSGNLGYHEATDKPAIVIQDPQGRVIWRASDYSSGPQGLATALRKADPNYDRKKDPGPSQPELPGGVDGKHALIVLVILAASAIAIPKKRVKPL